MKFLRPIALTVAAGLLTFGGNAVAAWGYTNETASDPGRPVFLSESRFQQK